jgi:arsenate reductase-like glutaredoxin family protein
MNWTGSASYVTGSHAIDGNRNLVADCDLTNPLLNGECGQINNLAFQSLKLGERDLSDDEIVDVMVRNPDLIQRPIVEKGTRAILARPAERLKEIL